MRKRLVEMRVFFSRMSRLLYVDALNYSHHFFPKRQTAWSLPYALSAVKRFVAASQRSSITVKVFIDGQTGTKEADEKWRRRREIEVQKRKRFMPQGLQALIGEMFHEAGVEVHYSVECDNDDTLAFFAQADGADVLSEDTDFFRYTDSTFRLYSDFYFDRGWLCLEPHAGKRKPGVKKRAIEPKPVTVSTCPMMIGINRKKHYLRGAPSPLVRLLGNPHIAVRPLRLALYHHLAIEGPIREEFPVWGADRTEWDIMEVMPDGACSGLLGDPESAIKQFFPELAGERPQGVNAADWSKHQFAARGVVHEICCAANQTSYLRAMMGPLVPRPAINPAEETSKERKGGRGGKGGKGRKGGKGGKGSEGPADFAGRGKGADDYDYRYYYSSY